MCVRVCVCVIVNKKKKRKENNNKHNRGIRVHKDTRPRNRYCNIDFKTQRTPHCIDIIYCPHYLLPICIGSPIRLLYVAHIMYVNSILLNNALRSPPMIATVVWCSVRARLENIKTNNT